MERICEKTGNSEVLARARRLTAESTALLAVVKRLDTKAVGNSSRVCQCPVCKAQYNKAVERFEERFEFGAGI